MALAANFISGVISVVLGAFGPQMLRIVPPAALLVPVAGIGFAFLGLEQVSTPFGAPLVGFLVRIKKGEWKLLQARETVNGFLANMFLVGIGDARCRANCLIRFRPAVCSGIYLETPSPSIFYNSEVDGRVLPRLSLESHNIGLRSIRTSITTVASASPP